MIHKEIIDELNFIKIKYFSSENDNAKKMRIQAIEWENIFTKDTG